MNADLKTVLITAGAVLLAGIVLEFLKALFLDNAVEKIKTRMSS